MRSCLQKWRERKNVGGVALCSAPWTCPEATTLPFQKFIISGSASHCHSQLGRVRKNTCVSPSSCCKRGRGRRLSVLPLQLNCERRGQSSPCLLLIVMRSLVLCHLRGKQWAGCVLWFSIIVLVLSVTVFSSVVHTYQSRWWKQVQWLVWTCSRFKCF